MATQIWVDIGPGNAVLLDDTESLPEPIIDLSSKMSRNIHLRAIS